MPKPQRQLVHIIYVTLSANGKIEDHHVHVAQLRIHYKAEYILSMTRKLWAVECCGVGE